MSVTYDSGTDFFRDTAADYGMKEALIIGGNYLSTQLKQEQPKDEIEFCRELFAAMYEAAANTPDGFMSVYPHDYRTAYDMGEGTLFSQSRERNHACAANIDYLINASQYTTNRYNLELAAMRAAHDYGFERVNMVLARNIGARLSDGRFSGANKQWAQETAFPSQGFECALLNAHPILIEDFTKYVRKLYDEVGAERFTQQWREKNSEPPAATEKSSVLKQIRDAQGAPKPPAKPRASGKNKDAAER